MGDSHKRSESHSASDDQPYLVYRLHADGSPYPTVEFGKATNGAGKDTSAGRIPLSSEDVLLSLNVLMQMYPPGGRTNA
jgi:hypothetical protein